MKDLTDIKNDLKCMVAERDDIITYGPYTSHLSAAEAREAENEDRQMLVEVDNESET
jgi:hypothetical protein